MTRPTQIPEGAHPTPNISKFTVGGNLPGLIIVVSIVVMALIGLPQTRWFLGGAAALGIAIALVLRWRARA